LSASDEADPPRGAIGAAPGAGGAEAPAAAPTHHSRGWGVRWRRAALLVAGPALIAVAVLVVLRGFVAHNLVSNQQPDLLAFWMPMFCALGRSLRALQIPQWNPFAMGGAPFAADPQSGWMYLPAMVLFGGLPCGLATRAIVVLQPLLGGIGLYAFLRTEGLSRAASAVGGLALALGLAGARLGLFLPFPSSLAWGAVTLAACAKLLRARRPAAVAAWAGATALAWGQMAAAHLAHGLVIGTGLLVAYIAAFAWTRLRHRPAHSHGDGEPTEGPADGPGRSLALRLVLLLGLMVVLNLAFFVPRIEYLARSSYGPAFADTSQLEGLRAPTWALDLATAPGGYLGGAALILSFAALWSRRRRAFVAAVAGFGLLCYLGGLHVVGSWLGPALAKVPLLEFYRHYPARLSLGLLLVIPILAAAGLETWVEARSGRDRVLMLVPGAAVWAGLPLVFGASPSAVALAVAGGAATVACLAVSRRRAVALALIPVVLAVDLVAAGLLGQRPGAAARAEASQPFGNPAWFAPLESPTVSTAAYLDPGPIGHDLLGFPDAFRTRFLGIDPALVSRRGYLTHQDPDDWGLLVNQRGMLLGLEDVQGYNPVQVRRYWELVRAVSPIDLDYNAAVFPRPPPAVLNLLFVGFAVGPSGAPPLPDWMPVANDGRWTLYRSPDPPRRVTVATKALVVGGPTQALATILAPGFDPTRTVVLESAPGGPVTARPVAEGITDIAYVSLGPQAARILVGTRRGGIAVIRNLYDPNWHASIDGRAVPLLRVDYLLQGVRVPPGRHIVELRYDDPWIRPSLWASVLALLAVALAALLLARRDRRARRGGHEARAKGWVDRGRAWARGFRARVASGTGAEPGGEDSSSAQFGTPIRRADQ
jgi:hypothetical protein